MKTKKSMLSRKIRSTRREVHKRSARLLLFLAITVIASGLWAANAGAAPIYVDVANISGTENGTASNPFITIQEGIEKAGSGGVVHVADGTYTGEGNKNLVLDGIKDITIRSANGPEHTIIDLEYSGRAFSFQGESTLILDGFTIKNGLTTTGGGAIYSSGNSSPVIRNCDFSRNKSTSGGAIYYVGQVGSNTEISNCKFSYNRSKFTGGAMSLNAGSFLIKDSSFQSNIGTGGGALSIGTEVVDGVIANCAFLNNHVRYAYNPDDPFPTGGGAIYTRLDTNSRFHVMNSTFLGNKTQESGGAVKINLVNGATNIEYTFTHCTFANNEAGDVGGAIYAHGSIGLYNSILWGNKAEDGGNQIYLASSESTPEILSIGYSDLEGGLKNIGKNDYAQTQFTVNILGGMIDLDPKFALEGDLHLMPDSPCIDTGSNIRVPADLPDLNNNGDTTEQLPYDADGNPRISSGTVDMGAYEFDPLAFPVAAVSPAGFVFTAREVGPLPEGQTLFIRNRGLGTNGPLNWKVIEEIPWLRVEPPIGVSEEEPVFVRLYADHTGLGHGIYTGNLHIAGITGTPIFKTVQVTIRVTGELHVPSPYDTIQEAVLAAIDGDVVAVAAGTYTTDDGDGMHRDKNIQFFGKAITVKGVNGPEYTIIECYNSGKGFLLNWGETSDSVVEGFTIIGGNSTWGGGIEISSGSSPTIIACIFKNNVSFPTTLKYSWGGAICIRESKAYIRNCKFLGNEADRGGGIGIYNGSATIENCFFSENKARVGLGGGIYCVPLETKYSGMRFTVMNSPFEGNTAAEGGAIACKGGSQPVETSIQGCFFTKNHAETGGGGGIYLEDVRDSSVINCVFSANEANTWYGGGILANDSGLDLKNCSFYSNLCLNKGGAIYVMAAGTAEFSNSIFWENTRWDSNSSTFVSDDISKGSNATTNVAYCAISDSFNWPADPQKGIINDDPLFVDADGPDDVAGNEDDDFRLDPSSPCIDMGKKIQGLFSDIRGSVRPVDITNMPRDAAGNPVTQDSAFDMGAYEFSEDYGGIEGDLTTKAFKELKIGGSLVVTGFEYEIKWEDKDPFPYDTRIKNPGEYDVIISLVNDQGLRIDLGTHTVEVSQHGYTIPFTFGPEHIGTWRIRVELVSDPNQFALSDEFSIEYKEAKRYALSQWIRPPLGADPSIRPDVAEEDVCYWSVETNRLYAIAPITTVIIWYGDEQKTIPYPVVAYISYPNKAAYDDDPDTIFHVADSMPVNLLPAGTRFDLAEIKWTGGDATMSGNLLQASKEGWSVIHFRDDQDPNPDTKEQFDVIRTLTWNHQDSPDDDLDMQLPVESAWSIGAAVQDTITTDIYDWTHKPECGSGYVFFEGARYDGYGETKAYDRETRQGPIFPVNEDLTGDIEDDTESREDDFVVVWYKTSDTSGVCWPSKPARYDAQWPDDAQKIVIASGLGSGPLDPATYGAMENMLIYNQPDRAQPGYNANEEHAAFFTAQGSEYPAVFALRTDLNSYYREEDSTWRGPFASQQRATSEPYVLLKYKDPNTAEWAFEVFEVVAQSGSYVVYNGDVVADDGSNSQRYYIDETHNLTDWTGALPETAYYLDTDGHLVSHSDSSVSEEEYYIDETGQLTTQTGDLPPESYYLDIHGVIVESDTYYRFHYAGTAGQEINPPYPVNQLTFGPCSESYTSTPTSVLEDKVNKFFAKHGGYNGEETEDVVLHYFYRLQTGFWYDLDENGVPDKTVGTPLAWLEALDETFDNEPVAITYSLRWPDPVPTLHVGETLLDAKTQEGETVGLPNVKDQCIVKVLFDQPAVEGGSATSPDYTLHSVNLIDPLKEYSFEYRLGDPENELPQDLKPRYSLSSGRWMFTALPYHLQVRLTYDPVAGFDPATGESGELKLKGYYTTGTGEPTLLLNALTSRDIDVIDEILADELPRPDPVTEGDLFWWAVDKLQEQGDAALDYPGVDEQLPIPEDGYPELMYSEMKALTAGDARGTGYVTLAFNNHEDCPAPTMLSVIKVGCPLYTGEIKVIESENPFEEKLTLRHNGDFGGNSDERWFQWKYLPADFSGIPEGPDSSGKEWKDYFAVVPEPNTPNPVQWDENEGGQFYKGALDVTVQGTGQQLLPDKWFSVRYYCPNICAAADTQPQDDAYELLFSEWTKPQLYEGWVKRVMKKINLFDQKVKDFHASDVNTLASMIAQAGSRYEGEVALSDDPEYLQNLGIIEVYETLRDHGGPLVGEDGDYTDINKALLFAANRLADLYMLLGNEAYGDATDPTIGFSTKDGQVGSEASSIFCFENQVDSLLEEELALLRGRDDEGVRPFYNRLIWNFTLGDGEVAYKENYNITDQATDQDGDGFPDTMDGEVNEYDAMVLYPQGHGDAWGHYLMAVKKYYSLLKAQNFTWIPQSEAILVAGTPVEVDYRDERKFASAAAAKAKAGSEIVNLTYRQYYTEDPEGQWQGYKDLDPVRAWGVDGWTRRTGQGALFDWVVGNAILPSETENPTITEEQSSADGQTAFTLQAIHYNPDTDPRVLQVFVNDVLKDTAAYEVTCDPGVDPILTTVTFSQGLAEGDAVRFELITLVEGIQRVDRSTVVELQEVASQYNAVQGEVDRADVGLNPLGLAKHAVPFDIDPGGIANGQTHFEQIYDRAVQAMNNAIAVFNHANQSTMLLRRQQDTLADFKRNIENSEADFNNRLIEVFGYPYSDDCGPGKTYSTDYAQTGPDLYHYMYVDPSELMGVEAPEVHEWVQEFKDIQPDASGALTESVKEVSFHVATDSRFGLIKPPEWQGRRKAPGEIQLARSDLLQARARFEKALVEYDNLLFHIERQADLIELHHGLNVNEISILNRDKGRQQNLNSAIRRSRYRQLLYRKIGSCAVILSNAVAEALPTNTGVIAGLAGGVILDATSVIRSAIRAGGAFLNETMSGLADVESLAELDHQHAKEMVSAQTNIELTALRGGFAVEQELLQLENLIHTEATLRLEIYNLAESMQQSAGRYLSALARGDRLLRDRLRFRKQTAAQIQDYRYKDMTFRIFRNDALQKYRAQFDLAARYVYLAAKAYDYETTLLDYDTMAGQAFLTDIVKQRTIGLIEGGLPLTGTGLADPMKRMWQNFQVLKPQLGFNNPQEETNRFSLRRELFRIKIDESSNDTWRQVLEAHRVDNLWDIPEFKRYCRPFAPEGIPQPGIVIPFSTTVTSGLNFFEWPLGGNDSYYSATNFATKVRSVGVWFSNYNSTQLAQTPRIYVVPVGEDVLRTPSYYTKDIRTWQVMDQKLPVPFPIVETEMENNPGWIPTVDTIFDEMFQIRRHSDFRAYHDSGYVNESEMTFDSRLIGRSVWNTRWLLIIPGQSLLYDPDEGLERFIHGPEVMGGYGERTGRGVSDVKLFFHTYAYSGN